MFFKVNQIVAENNALSLQIRNQLPIKKQISGLRFESQAHHLRFFQIVYLSFELECEKNESKQKEAWIGPF